MMVSRLAVVDALATAIAHDVIERVRRGEYAPWPLEDQETEALRYALEDSLRSLLGAGRRSPHP
jgi:hypothetical protein